MVDKVALKERRRAKLIRDAKVIGKLQDPRTPTDYSKKKRKNFLVTKRLPVREALDPQFDYDEE